MAKLAVTGNTVHVAVAVITRDAAMGVREVLISKRAANVHQGGLWEFPGGKVELGESVQCALRRELAEELGIEIALADNSLSPLIQIHHDYGDKQVLLDVFELSAFNGTPFGQEGQQVRWVPVSELEKFEFPAANTPIISACQLPFRISITPALTTLADARQYLEHLQSIDISHVILRQPGWHIEQYCSWAEVLLSEFEGSRLRVLLHGDPTLLKNIPGAHVHLPAAIALRHQSLSDYKNASFSMSCHDRLELDHARELGVKFVTLSPIAVTSSHPEAIPIGWKCFSSLVDGTNVPVYALGGMTDSDVSVARQHGAQGIAAITAWALD